MSNRSMMEVGWHKAEKHLKDNESTYHRRLKYLKPYLKEKIKVLEVDDLQVLCYFLWLT